MQSLQTTICPYCTSSNPHFSRLCATCGSRLQNATLPTGLRLKDGFYELEGVLGQGGFGITYLARHTGLGTKVALKELYPDYLVMRDSSGKVRAQAGMQSEFESLKIRFSREAKTLRELVHNSSTKFISDWEEHGTVFIAMEFIDGETLEARIAQGKLLTEREAREVMLPILDLLQEVHGKGLLHRDIKPANIILTKNGGVELIDFGSVTKFNANQRSKITSRLLTPAYAPLEQYGQEVMLTPSTDLYALAATIYEAITGIAPVPALERANGKNLELLHHLEPNVTKEFSSVVMKALELRMEDRFSSASDLLVGIKPVLNRNVIHISTKKIPPNPRLILLLGGILILLCLTFILLNQFEKQFDRQSIPFNFYIESHFQECKLLNSEIQNPKDSFFSEKEFLYVKRGCYKYKQLHTPLSHWNSK